MLSENCRALQNAFDCAVLLIHHEGRAGAHERGTSAVKDASAFQLRLKKVNGEGVRGEVYQLKNKYGPTSGEDSALFHYKVEYRPLRGYSQMTYGQDEWLRDQKGRLVIDGYCIRDNAMDRLQKNLEACLLETDVDLVSKAFAEKGKSVLAMTPIREALAGVSGSKNSQNVRNRFNRLVSLGHLVKEGAKYSLADLEPSTGS